MAPLPPLASASAGTIARRMWERAPVGLLAAALAASAALLFSLASNLTFVGDGWEVLAGRPDWSLDTFFEPFNEHPIILPALVYKLLLTLFGMESSLPYYVVSISLFLLCAVLLFVYMKRRIGDWGALAGAVLVLFLGAAYEDLLWEFQMGFFGSMAAGLGALLALDREDKFGDRIASVLLLVSTASSTLGIPFVIAGAAQVALGPRPRWRRGFVPLIPLAAYAVWWFASGRSAGSQVGLADIPELPRYVFDAAAAGIASLLGQQPIEIDGNPPGLAQLLTVVLGASLLWWVGRRRRMHPGLLVALILVFSFWGLLALDRGPQRFSSRFQYPSAVFLLIVAAEAMRGQRLPRLAVPVLVVVTTAAVVGGISLLRDGYSNVWRPTADQIRSSLAVIDIAGAKARPSYRISLPPSIFLSVSKYEEARRKHGTPAFTEARLLVAEEAQKQIADSTLVAALGLRLRRATAAMSASHCRELFAAGLGSRGTTLAASGRFQLRNHSGAALTMTLGRFSEITPAPLGGLPAHSASWLELPRDRSPRPWRLSVSGDGARLCAAG